MMVFAHPDELEGAVGTRLGESSWHEVPQHRIDLFAEATGDRQWIHRDCPEAHDGPFGAPVAHGYLTVALLPELLAEVVRVDGADMLLNGGMDRLRFHAPVRAGARVRAVADLASARTRARGFTEIVLAVTLEIEGSTRSALTAQVRTLVHSRS